MTVPINNPQPDSYGDSVPYQGSMPYQSGGLYPGDGFYQGGVPYQNGGFYQGGVPYQNGGFYQGGGPYLGYPQTYVSLRGSTGSASPVESQGGSSLFWLSWPHGCPPTRIGRRTL